MNALEQRVLELIGEDVDSPDVFTDDSEGMAQIRESIADAIQEILMITGGNKRQYFLPLREGQAFYRLRLENGDIGWVTDVWSVVRQTRLEQTDLTRVSSYDPRWMITSAPPEAYLPIGQDIIGFYPKPSGSSDVMEITLVEIPHVYETDRDRLKLREAFKYATVNYAVADFWASRGDAAEAQKHLQMYMDTLGLKQGYNPMADRFPKQETAKEPWPTSTG
jgi:hypothetical protein